MTSLSDPVLAALIGGIALIGSGVIAVRGAIAQKRAEAAAATLNAQTTGWSSLHQAAVDMAKQWREELRQAEAECDKRMSEIRAECEARIGALQADMTRQERMLREQIAGLEERLRRLGARVDDMDASQ